MDNQDKGCLCCKYALLTAAERVEIRITRKAPYMTECLLPLNRIAEPEPYEPCYEAHEFFCECMKFEPCPEN